MTRGFSLPIPSSDATAATFSASGLTGATAASRYVGATTSGAPTSGTFAVGDYVVARNGKVWICTTAGSPGTWTAAGATVGTTAGTVAAGDHTHDSGVVVNLKAAGVPYDGVTDGLAAAQAIIDAAADGSVIEFSPGTLLVSGTLKLKAKVTYRGHGVFQSRVKLSSAASGAKAVLAAAAWATPATAPIYTGDPVRIERLWIDGNKTATAALNPTCHGIVLMNWQSEITDCQIDSAPADGIRLADSNSAGTGLSNTSVENRITKNRITNCGDAGIYVEDNVHSLTDGYCVDNLVAYCGGHAINIARGSGWKVDGNHTYCGSGAGKSAITVGAGFGTSITNNYVDGYGQSATTGTWSAIKITQLSGRASVVSGNKITLSGSTAGSTYHHLDIEAGSGSTATVTVIGNTVNGLGVSNETGLFYYAPVGATLVATEAQNVTVGATTALSVAATVTLQSVTRGPSSASLFSPSGLTGATGVSRYVGGTTSGAPVSGTFAVGDYVIARDGKVWVCTTAGSPGTWVAAGATVGTTAGTVAAGNDSRLQTSSGLASYNIKTDFGAVGDDSTDDSAAFTAACAALGTGGRKRLIIPPGTYRITGNVFQANPSGATSLREYIEIVGAGRGITIIKQMDADADGLGAHNVRHLVVSDLTLRGPGSTSGQSGTGSGFVHKTQTTSAGFGMWWLDMHRVEVQYFGQDGVRFNYPIVGMASSVTVEYCGRNGFNTEVNAINGNGTSLTMVGCWARRCGAAGYYIDSQSYTTMISCATDRCGVGYYLTRCRGVVMVGCGVEAQRPNTGLASYLTGAGIVIDNCSGVTVQNPLGWDVRGSMVYVTGNSSYIRLLGVEDGHPSTDTDTGNPVTYADPSVKVDSGSTVTELVLGYNAGLKPANDYSGNVIVEGFSSSIRTLTQGLRITNAGSNSGGGLEVIGTADGSTSQGLISATGATTSKRLLSCQVSGDTTSRVRISGTSADGGGGSVTFGDGTTADAYINRSGTAQLATNADLRLRTAGKGLRVAEGSNAKQGTATLVAGAVTVSNTSVTATSRIFLTVQSPGGTVGAVYISARTAGTSFTISSTSGADTSVVAYEIFEVG